MLLATSEKTLKDGTKIWIQRLDDTHHRGVFTCSKYPVLADFLQKHALKNSELGLTKTYVATLPNSQEVIGYCAVSNGSIAPQILPNEGKGFPRYNIPTAHIGRLAIDDKWQGKGLGGYLLFFAIELIVDASERIGVYLIDVYAKDEQAANFYAHNGFLPLRDTPLHLFLPVKHAKIALAAAKANEETN